MSEEKELTREEILDKAQKEIFTINNKIARVNCTKRHYLAWMECSKTEKSKTFLEYLDDLKASYQEEIKYIRDSMRII